MLDLDSGPIHLSVEAGIGGTTLALSLAAKLLQENSRIVWFGRTMPNGERISQIFSELDHSKLEKFYAIEFGEDLFIKTKEMKPLLSHFTKEDLVIVDDWCPSQGRVPSSDFQAMKIIIDNTKSTRVLFISKAYENPSNEGMHWRSRGGKLTDLRQVWLLMKDDLRETRIIIDGTKEIELKLDNNGFSLTNFPN
jgi:hypothetical protein